MSIWKVAKVEVTSMNLNGYIDELKIEYPVYGDFLRFFTIKIGDLPSEFSTWLLKLGSFYDELQRMANNMLDAYIKFALLQAGYVPIGLMEIAEEEIAEMGGNLKDKTIEVTESLINDLLNGEYESYTVDEYINLENLKECIRIKLISFQPDIWDDKVIFGWWGEEDTEELIKLSTELINSYCKSPSYLIVVDPLTYRIAKKFIQNLKRELEEKLGRNVILSTNELLNYFALDREKVEADWSFLREKAIEKLKKRYPFLSVHDEMWRIRRAREEIKKATAELSKGGLREEECEDIIRRISNAVEGYLGVFYHKCKGKPPEERTLGWLLNSLRSEIENEFGEDVFNDLSFINEKRIIVDHPKPVKVTIDDAVKVVRRAEIFRDLFEKMLSKGD